MKDFFNFNPAHSSFSSAFICDETIVTPSSSSNSYEGVIVLQSKLDSHGFAEDMRRRRASQGREEDIKGTEAAEGGSGQAGAGVADYFAEQDRLLDVSDSVQLACAASRAW